MSEETAQEISVSNTDPNTDVISEKPTVPVVSEEDSVKTDDRATAEKRKVFIGNLSWNSDEAGIEKYFSTFGELDMVDFKRDANGRPRGFAFVTFRFPETAEKVLKADLQVDGRRVEATLALPRGTKPPATTQNKIENANGTNGTLRSKRVYAGHLGDNIQEDLVRQTFQQYGTIRDIQIVLEHDTGRQRGFCFVTFDTEDEADKCFADRASITYNGRLCEIRIAEPRRAPLALDRKKEEKRRHRSPSPRRRSRSRDRYSRERSRSRERGRGYERYDRYPDPRYDSRYHDPRYPDPVARYSPPRYGGPVAAPLGGYDRSVASTLDAVAALMQHPSLNLLSAQPPPAYGYERDFDPVRTAYPNDPRAASYPPPMDPRYGGDPRSGSMYPPSGSRDSIPVDPRYAPPPSYPYPPPSGRY